MPVFNVHVIEKSLRQATVRITAGSRDEARAAAEDEVCGWDRDRWADESESGGDLDREFDVSEADPAEGQPGGSTVSRGSMVSVVPDGRVWLVYRCPVCCTEVRIHPDAKRPNPRCTVCNPLTPSSVTDYVRTELEENYES